MPKFIGRMGAFRNITLRLLCPYRWRGCGFTSFSWTQMFEHMKQDHCDGKEGRPWHTGS